MKKYFLPQRDKENLECRKQEIVLLFAFYFLLFTFSTFGQQSIAIITPEKNEQAEQVSEKLEKVLAKEFSTVDSSMSEMIFRSKNFENPFNLTVQESQNLGVTIGCNFFILIKTDTLRRSSLERNDYYESFAAIYLVSSRSGKLVLWKYRKFEEDSPQKSKEKLFESLNLFSKEIAEQIKFSTEKEVTETNNAFEELTELPSNKDFRPPMPYRRFKPKYTDLAGLYDILATVDILVDVDENGKIVNTEIVRWAGFGLNESVVANIKRMNWRPATQNGKSLPMRVLLRYNFKNVKNDK